MKKMSDFLDTNLNVLVKNIKINSKDIEEGDCFVCVKGVNSDRHDYIKEAIEKKASCLIVEKDGNYSIPYVKISDLNNQLGQISRKFYENPCDKLKIIGITGTDGKTTTASIVRNMIGNDITGYIGTNGFYLKEKKESLNNTTPEICKIYKILDLFVKNNLKYASMEISSEALYYNRTDTLQLDVALITNITEDHLNVHKTIDNYIETKKKIFNLLKKDGVAIINKDDNNFDKIINNIKNPYLTFGKSINTDLTIREINEYESGTIFSFDFNEKTYKVISPLIGVFNVYNLCGVILSMYALGFNIDDVLKRIVKIENVDGRCEFLDFGQPYRIVLDYAHTPNALDNILEYLNKIKKDGRIITVTGSAGGREKQKRGKMGKIVLTKSDYVIFTMDDPRNENVDDIIDDLVSECDKKNYIRINDRENAIFEALKLADGNDIVLIAGKGRDNYMAVKDKKIDYQDYNVIKTFFNKLNL